MELKAKWIWHNQNDYNRYNQTIVARRAFSASAVDEAVFRITADSFYRLYINGKWVNDGPCRSWPENYQFDEIDVSPYLKPGSNEIRIVARYFGAGDFHRVPQQAGLWAQLNIRSTDGSTETIITDESWETAEATAWVSNTPKISVQMEAAEYYDARKEDGLLFRPAAVLFDAEGGPWKNFNPRDVALLTKKPVDFKSFAGANLVEQNTGIDFCLPATRLVHPGLIEGNINTSMPCGMASVFKNRERQTLELSVKGFKVAVDGVVDPDGRYDLEPGEHLVLALSDKLLNHHRKEKSLRLADGDGFVLENPLSPEHENPWVYFDFKDYVFAENDLKWQQHFLREPRMERLASGYAALTDGLQKKVVDKETFSSELGGTAKILSSEEMFVHDFHAEFENRRVVGKADGFVENPSSLMLDGAESTTVHPAPGGDVELIYDLGEQNCGYYRFELDAADGVVIDINGVEHISNEGKVQHPPGNRNGMRYVTRKGLNRFTSLKRRSGRYVFLTLRNVQSPVKIGYFDLVESTYPVESTGSFECSDSRLNRIWEISERTLKLCTEDVFTDCPLYEQTLWVGDVRNEALFAYPVFGGYDVAKRSIKLAAQSLDRFPMVGAQVPSSWDMLLPAWSFLWGVSVWEYYWQTGDEAFLREMWDAVIKNLKGAYGLLDDRGLFSGPFWNLFDWSGIDDGHKTVVHNSMLLVGAIGAASKCAEVVGDNRHNDWLEKFREDLCKSVSELWDAQKQAYPDSVHDDGTVSESVCQHTSFLSLLYDVVEEGHVGDVLKNMTEPPAGMVQVGSPFALMYLYEALEKAGLGDGIIASIYEKYQPMLDAGATTVWESFPSGVVVEEMARDGFNVRSRCHGWSAAPLYFLGRIILGVRQVEPGGTAFEISPVLNGLTRAKGAVATVNGPVSVAWEVKDKTVEISYSAPPGVRIDVVGNASHKGLALKKTSVQYLIKNDHYAQT